MKYILEVTSRAVPGRDADYNEWYDTTHVVDVLGLPGFNACQRYVRANPGAEGPAEYVAAYEVETDDPAALIESLMVAAPKMQLTDSIDLTSVRFDFLLPKGERRT
jgi:hypothetical protein